MSKHEQVLAPQPPSPPYLPMPPSSKSAGKRKKRVLSDDDSDIEIVDPPLALPPRKKPATENRRSTSHPIHKTLSTISVIDAVDAIIQGQSGASPSSTRSPRVRVKTERGRLLEAASLASPRRVRKAVALTPVVSESDSDLPVSPTTVRRATIKQPRVSPEAGVSDDGGVDTSDSANNTNPATSPKKVIAALQVASPGSPGSADENTTKSATSDITAKSGIAIDDEFQVVETQVPCGPVSPASSDMDEAPTGIPNSGVQSPGSGSDVESETVSDMVAKKMSPGRHEMASEVMDVGLQHPDLRQIYHDLPHLPTLCEIRVWNYPRGPEMLERVDFEQLKQVLSDRTTILLLRGLNFNRSDCFVNMARADPKWLAPSADKRRIVMAGGGDINVIGIMNGRISVCNVVNAYTAVSQSGGSYSFRRAILSPWAQEIRRDTSMWGLKLGFKTITSSACEDGLSFNSRRKTAYSSPSAPTTPKKPRSRFAMTVTSPSVKTGDGQRGVGGKAASYAISRSFDESIPIYDGRASHGSPFTFSDADFANLSKWPLYKKGRADLPVDAIVTIGYTVNLYEWPVGSKDDQLSTNLQFIILLGIPVAPPA